MIGGRPCLTAVDSASCATRKNASSTSAGGLTTSDRSRRTSPPASRPTRSTSHSSAGPVPKSSRIGRRRSPSIARRRSATSRAVAALCSSPGSVQPPAQHRQLRATPLASMTAALYAMARAQTATGVTRLSVPGEARARARYGALGRWRLDRGLLGAGLGAARNVMPSRPSPGGARARRSGRPQSTRIRMSGTRPSSSRATSGQSISLPRTPASHSAGMPSMPQYRPAARVRVVAVGDRTPDGLLVRIGRLGHTRADQKLSHTHRDRQER